MSYCRFLAMLAVVGLVGCVQAPAPPTTIKLGNVTYPNREAALAAFQRDLDRDTAHLEPANQRLGGSLFVAFPNHQVLHDVFYDALNPKNPTMADVNADVYRLIYGNWVNGIAKTKVVDKAEFQESADPEHEAFDGFDYKLWAVRNSSGQLKWYLTKADGTTRDVVFAPASPSTAIFMANLNIAVLNGAADLGAPVSRQPFQTNNTNHAGPISGTSFQINAAGFALTNAHVVDACKSIKLLVGEGVEADATLVAADKVNDLAVIKIPPRPGAHAVFRAGPPVRQGEEVVLYGFPLAGALTTTGNLSTGIISALAGLREDSAKYQISAPVQPGNSGGPLFDAGGDVIGVVQSKLNAMVVAAVTGDVPQNVNFAVKSSVVANFLDTNGIHYDTAPFKTAVPMAELSDKARGFTFMVKCQH